MSSWLLAIILAVAALATSTLSGILGMGGGMLLLAVLFGVMPHAEAIPTHAAVQIVSNSTRVLAFRRNVDWPTLGRFTIGVVPGSAMGIVILATIGRPEDSDPYLKMLVGVFILITTFLPRPRTRGGESPISTTHESAARTAPGPWWDFPLLGLAAGVAGLTIGAVGPLLAPMFARRAFVKERLIATKAICQMVTHVIKIPAFIFVADLDVARLGGVTLVMCLAVVPGTLLGRRLLKRVSDRHFVLAYRVALAAAGVKVLLWDGVFRLVRGF